MTEPAVHVAVGVILNADNEVLISKRSSDVHQGGLWEFPGGKIESGESPVAALCRELREEVGIVVLKNEFLISVDYDYGDKIVRLHTFIVNEFSGMPAGLEGQPTQWVDIDNLHKYTFPKANIPIISTLQLPDVIQITGEFSSFDDLLLRCEKSINNGVRVLQFRAHELDDDLYIEYAKKLSCVCRKRNVKFIVNRTVKILKIIDADGLHLSRHEMMKYNKRPLGIDKLFSVSCHNESEIKHAQLLSVDYCFLSPVKNAVSHDAGRALGLEIFSRLVKGSEVPVYALGGMNMEDIEVIKKLKGKGIATVSVNW